MKFSESYCLPKTSSPFDWSLQDYINNELAYPTLCEVLQDDKNFVRPYFDFDLKLNAIDRNNIPVEAPTTNDELDEWVKCLIFTIKSFFANFDDDDCKIVVAYRPPSFIEEKKKLLYKISLRFFVNGLMTSPEQLKEHMIFAKSLVSTDVDKIAFSKLQRGIADQAVFDPQVYSQNRKMNCLGKMKKISDRRVLVPYPGYKGFNKEDFLIQYLIGNEKEAVFTQIKRRRESGEGTFFI